MKVSTYICTTATLIRLALGSNFDHHLTSEAFLGENEIGQRTTNRFREYSVAWRRFGSTSRAMMGLRSEMTVHGEIIRFGN